jgi:hypothetical protein
MRIHVTIEGDPLRAVSRKLAEAGGVVAQAVAQAGAELRQEMRNQWRATGHAPRLANTWAMKFYRNQGLNAAALVYSKAPQIMQAHTYGATIQASSGRYLAIPTGFNRQGGRRGAKVLVTAKDMARTRGMTFVQRSKAGALLWWMRVAVSSRLRKTMKDGRPRFHSTGVKDARIAGRVIRDRKRRQLAVKYGAVPMFVLVRQVRIRKVLDLKGAARHAQARLANFIRANWK